MPEYTCLSHISVAGGPVEVSLRRMACSIKSRTYIPEYLSSVTISQTLHQYQTYFLKLLWFLQRKF